MLPPWCVPLIRDKKLRSVQRITHVTSVGNVDFIPIIGYDDLAWLAEGRLPETFGGWSEVRSLRARLVTSLPGGLGAPPPGYYGPGARSSLMTAGLPAR